MKATDLMIGDWVYNTHNRQNEQVAEIGSGLVMLAYNDLYEYDEIEPIPLTPEILKKNGFELKNDGWLWCAINSIEDKNYIFIQYRKGCQEVRLCEMNFVNNVIMRSQSIQYVHELQHALKLRYIKKEIVL